MQQRMESEEERLFATSFQVYLKHGRNDTAFVVDLDDVWRWLGYSRKDPAKRVVMNTFTQDVDYVLLHNPVDPDLKTALWAQEGNDGRGGHNKETVMMNVRTFKKLCMKANNEQGEKVQDYYLKLEEIIPEQEGSGQHWGYQAGRQLLEGACVQK